MTDYPPPPDSELLAVDELALDVSSTEPDRSEYVDPEALASFNLKRIRSALGVSQQEVADRLAKLPLAPRLSQSQIAKIERGERPWKVNELFWIASVLNLDFNDFFQGLGADNVLDLDIADARIRLAAVQREEEMRREELVDAKRKMREAEDVYIALVAQRGDADAEALRILHFRYYVNEAKALEMESYREMVDQDKVKGRSSDAEKWARAELQRLTEEAAKKPRKPKPRDERFPDPDKWFAEMTRDKATGKRKGRDGLPDYL